MARWNVSKHTLWIAGLVALFAFAPMVFAADGDKSTVKGLITAIDGDTVTVRDGNNVDHKITLTDATEIKKKEGLAAVRFERMQRSALIAGLPIVADLVAQGDQLQATAISFRSDDMRTAQQVQAGVAPTSTKVDAMGKRMDDFGKYEAVQTAEVMFASGSTSLSEKGKADLMSLATKAKEIQNYAVVMQGFTDSTGDAAANERLSKRRAEAVANFLQRQGGLQPGRVTAGDGMGVAPDAGSGSNANARKVVVKLVVDKGVAGSAK
ncbi:Outer membrane protein, OmpA/MotB family [Lysobacter dokdonensis DS-58]|uniref:Outer membrane protein, OmpA/MotB family n=1 Tax=Lysobacter dokdonensis DS-58 TaxID=1300345 RepID=A0A0A2WHY6_9GAMM|nr:OmpA family protein [Lysobacter dokdonensis]KGQ19423.1 Outer membrane protein, OmpA/MotB family [Lysobacter dokdonensis DS-58]